MAITALVRPALLALLACSLTVNVGLGAYTYLRDGGFRAWGSFFGATPVAVDGQARVPIPVGAMAPPLQAVDPDTTENITLTFGSRPTVLYVISPMCQWCVRNTANMAALHRQRSADYAFIGLSLSADNLSTYLSANPLPFKVFVASPQALSAYGLGATPATIVIAKGSVARKFNGAWRRSLPSVEEFFSVSLPGLNDAPS